MFSTPFFEENSDFSQLVIGFVEKKKPRRMKKIQHAPAKGSNTQQNDGSFAGTVTLLGAGEVLKVLARSRYSGYGTFARKHVMIVVQKDV